MPIRKPTKTTIRSNDFRNHAFSFPVESVLKPQQGTGELVIRASPGYLLTTAPDAEPLLEQTLDHVLQPNGSMLAKGTITLLTGNEPQAEGTVTIRNPAGEEVVLTVYAPPEIVPAMQEPLLEVSDYELLFAKTPPGTPTFRVFMLAQQNADTPVTITTDAPEFFQLASDSRPAYFPSLTLVPSSSGTYVHVRYAADRSAGTEAVLTIETPYATKYIDLTSPRTGWLPAVRGQRAIRLPETEPVPKRASATRWIWLSQLLVVSLVVAGYQFRCQLMPSLCQEATKPALSVIQPPVTSPLPMVDTPEVVADKQNKVPPVQSKPGSPKSARVPVTDTTSLESDDVVESPEAQKPVSEPIVEPASPPPVSSARVQPARRPQLPRQTSDSLRADQPKRPAVPAPTAESELERALNKKPVEQ